MIRTALKFVVFVVAMSAVSASAAVPVLHEDSRRPDGQFWDPRNNAADGDVFKRFDTSAIPEHVPPAFEAIKASDRPVFFQEFLIAGVILVSLFVLVVTVFRRRQVRAFIKGWRSLTLPDDTWPMITVIGVAFVCRITGIKTLALHGSEWGSVECGRLSDVAFNGYEVLTNPPLLNLLEHFVYPVCLSPVCFRFPVLLFGLMLVWAARCSARELFGRRAGIIAGLFCAVNCGLVVWSITMRAYLPMAALVVSALPATFRIAQGTDRDRDAVKLALFGGLAVWTHYIALIWLLCLFVVAAWGRRRDARSLVRMLLAGTFIGLAFLPLAPFFFADFADKQASMIRPEYAGQLLALATGLPLMIGLAVPAGLVAGRFWRNRSAVWLSIIIGGYIALSIVTSGFIHWEISYSVGLSAIMMILVAGVVAGLKHWRPVAGLMVALLALTSALIWFEPSNEPLVYKATRPFLWRSASNELFADRIRSLVDSGKSEHACSNILVTPAYESEPYLYYLGPVTPAEAGVEPVVGRNFDEMVVSGRGRNKHEFRVVGFERYWPWLLGQWPELERFAHKYGCFWYARLQQNCQTGLGFSYSEYDCGWLAGHCSLIESTAADQLYLCGSGRVGSDR